MIEDKPISMGGKVIDYFGACLSGVLIGGIVGLLFGPVVCHPVNFVESMDWRGRTYSLTRENVESARDSQTQMKYGSAIGAGLGGVVAGLIVRSNLKEEEERRQLRKSTRK